MEFLFGRVRYNLLKIGRHVKVNQSAKLYTKAANWLNARHKKLCILTCTTICATFGALFYELEQTINASGNRVHPPQQRWSHCGVFQALDHDSVRRGYEVYKQVCSTCYSLQYMAYRNLVNVTHTEAEAKAEAEQITVQNGPNEEGEFFERSGKLSDYFKSPYGNEQAARAANNGAYTPDLSYIVSARKGGEDYIFALLTGYCDAPAGIILRDGQYFNPYFDGGAISMGQILSDDAISYADGTPATASQMAKDVCTFLKWTAEPEHNLRKLLLIKVTLIMSFLIGISYYAKRHCWSSLKSRKIFFVPLASGKSK